WPLTSSRVNGMPDFAPANEAFLWMNQATEDPGGVQNPEMKPAYGVIAPWHFGPWLNYIAERPALATPFILSVKEQEAIRMSIDFFLATEEMEAVKLAENQDLRYVVVREIDPFLPTYLEVQGRSMADFVGATKSLGDDALHYAAVYYRTMTNQMLLLDGCREERLGLPGLGQFRIVYESSYHFQRSVGLLDGSSKAPPLGVSSVKIFERMKGARLEGMGAPLEEVVARLRVRTNQGRVFVYEKGVRSDETGRFSMRVPYAPGEKWEGGLTRALGLYEITGVGGSARTAVTEEQVRLGARVEVGALKHGAAEAAPEGNSL
ncbi:MAG: hypothetical protein Q8R92_06180, partial [Deltaproteobacteria bacterium]|nr:hypothetical protein [Deltaproteobacteria bacterium]